MAKLESRDRRMKLEDLSRPSVVVVPYVKRFGVRGEAIPVTLPEKVDDKQISKFRIRNQKYGRRIRIIINEKLKKEFQNPFGPTPILGRSV